MVKIGIRVASHDDYRSQRKRAEAILNRIKLGCVSMVRRLLDDGCNGCLLSPLHDFHEIIPPS